MRYLATLIFIFLGSTVLAQDADDGKNYVRIVCQEDYDGDLQNRVVILEQLDASFEDGKDLINPHKFYNSERVPFSLTIYENATLEGKPLELAISELKKRDKLPDYEGSAVHSGRGLAFVYNLNEIFMGIELSRPNSSVLHRDTLPIPLECKDPMTFRKALIADTQNQDSECSTDNCSDRSSN